jgi:hypothetical protein
LGNYANDAFGLFARDTERRLNMLFTSFVIKCEIIILLITGIAILIGLPMYKNMSDD